MMQEKKPKNSTAINNVQTSKVNYVSLVKAAPESYNTQQI